MKKHDDIEIIKAVAQAWYGHSGSSRAADTTSEFEAHRMFFKAKPSRFKLEAMSKGASNSTRGESCGANWDFGKSLWDSYEIISVSKKLERGLTSEDHFSDEKLKPKESKNSLRSLFNRVSSSRRFTTQVD